MVNHSNQSQLQVLLPQSFSKGKPSLYPPFIQRHPQVQLAAGSGGEATAGVFGDAAPCARGQVWSAQAPRDQRLVMAERRDLNHWLRAMLEQKSGEFFLLPVVLNRKF